MSDHSARIPGVIMRGGTSKCVVFHAQDLPSDDELRDRLLLFIMGSPDPRQIDGLGGSYSTTSKVCIIGPPSVPEADVDYTFAQVSITDPVVDYKGNCGNCSSAVGPFAIDEGLLEAVEPLTTVRIYNTNTRKISPGGAVTGKLLPTGQPQDIVEVPGLDKVPISIVDAGNPCVFILGDHLSKNGTESPGELDADSHFSERIENVRSIAAEMSGLVSDWRQATASSPAVPKSVFILPPADYKNLLGTTVAAEEMDILARIMSMQTCHRAFALTGAVATAAAAFTPGSVVYELVPDKVRESGVVRIGHPSGTMEMQVQIEDGEVKAVGAIRTSRRLMEGHVHVHEGLLEMA
jgi:2-methylaconitate cis-trans-isomerase PrpF